MSNEAFKRDFSKLLAKAGAKAELVVRKTALQLQTGMIEMAAVDTGRFKNNFVPGIGVVNPKADYPPDKSGDAAIERTRVALEGWNPGQTIYLTNSLPYARPLEYGHSGQMPNGCVRLTVQNYAKALADAVKGLP